MKTILLSLILALLHSSTAWCQDVLLKKSGEKIPAKVLAVSDSLIHFSSNDSLRTEHKISASEVHMITFRNGTRTVFRKDGEKITVVTVGPGNAAVTDYSTTLYKGEDSFQHGVYDAKIHYRGYKTASTGTLVVSILSPLAGLVPAVVTSLTPPASHTLNFPDIKLMDDPEYARGYHYGALKLKSGKVWTNFGIGAGFGAVIGILVYNYRIQQ